jgi:hypothetical protein
MVYRAFRWLNAKSNVVPFVNAKGHKAQTLQSNLYKENCKIVYLPSSNQKDVIHKQSILGILVIILSCVFLGPGFIIK